MDHLKQLNSKEEVAFITTNKSDFFFADRTNNVVLHPDLLQDLESTKSTLHPFAALFDFVDKTIDKDEHAIDYTKAESLFGEDLEYEGLRFLEALGPDVLAALQVALPASVAFTQVLSLTAEVMEGIEDFDVISTKQLGDGTVYVQCNYDMRIVIVTLEIASAAYHADRKIIDSSDRFFNAQPLANSINVSTTVRPYYSVSFIYNPEDECVTDYSISRFSLR